MIWVILAALGVPLWLCALALGSIVVRNRKLRKRQGNIVVRVKRDGSDRWRRAHALWVSDVFAWRGSPASWSEDMLHVSGAALRSPETEERKKLHRLGDGFVIASMELVGGGDLDVAASAEASVAVLGPFATTTVES